MLTIAIEVYNRQAWSYSDLARGVYCSVRIVCNTRCILGNFLVVVVFKVAIAYAGYAIVPLRWLDLYFILLPYFNIRYI